MKKGSYSHRFHNYFLWTSLKQNCEQEEQCDTKFRNLKKTYKRIKDNNNESGRGTIKWPYFERIDQMFAFTHAVTPLATASNIAGYVACPSSSTDNSVKITYNKYIFVTRIFN